MQPKPAYNLQQILALEDDDALLQIFCKGTNIPAWTLIRIQFIRAILSDLLFSSGILIGAGKRPAYFDLLNFLVRSQFHNFVNRSDRHSDICFFTTGLGIYERNGKIQDRLVSYFADCYPSSSFIYQEHGDWRWIEGGKSNATMHATPYNIYSQILGRIIVGKQHREMAREVVNLAARNVKLKLDYSLDQIKIETLIKSLSIQLAVLPNSINHYANWFAKGKIKLLFKENACYGARSVAILNAARISGVITAEYQHGGITKGHDGYNVASALANSEHFKETLPDYLLTYGDWWSQQTNMPIKKLSIGNPHLTESLKQFSKIPASKSRVLILGDGIDTQLYLNLASKVAQMHWVRGAPVVFRPHPLERSNVKNFNIPFGVVLDTHNDIYDSLRQSWLVISELSTGLFEAVGIVNKILLWETAKSRFAFPILPFPSFSTIDELEGLLEEDTYYSKHSEVSIKPDDLWAPNWELNYKSFIQEVLPS